MLRKMPILLLLIILATMLCGQLIPIFVKQVLYSLSFSIKSLIIFVLPFVIFSLLLKAMLTLSKQASKMVIITISLVCCSNFVSTFCSRYIGILIYNLNLSAIPSARSDSMELLWNLYIPPVLPNDLAMLLGILSGIAFAKHGMPKGIDISKALEKFIGKSLQILSYLIPIFVAGFLLKIQHEGLITKIAWDYAPIFCTVVLAQFSYIILLYLILNNFHLKSAVINIKNMFPAVVSGFCTMSGAASMPLTIAGVAANTNNCDISRSSVPLTVNIHLIGDCFAIPIFAYACLKSFGMPEPGFISYMIFTLYFVITKFSVAAIPGGGIIVMLPILNEYLRFNSEMLSLITALYILFDPIITSANILGNGAFAKLIGRIKSRWLGIS